MKPTINKVVLLRDGASQSRFSSPTNLTKALSSLYKGKHVSLIDTLPSGIKVPYFTSVNDDNITDTYTGDVFDINVLWETHRAV